MIERRRGKVINIASTAGMHAEPGQCDYGAAKVGVIQFTRSPAREVGLYGINVNCISPGMILGTAASASKSHLQGEYREGPHTHRHPARTRAA
jgi:NAD(P)-dependent dehydrogenase (short-subunit alcohol dehydrogenase family)